MGKNTLSAADRTKGKFRSLLLTTFRNFVIADGQFKGEEFVLNRGWFYEMQKDNTAVPEPAREMNSHRSNGR